MQQLTKLGKYLIRRELGQGAMGVVYEGFDPFIERTVAIKTVLKSKLDQSEAQEMLGRFRREAQAAGRLSHPNIIAIYEYGEDEGIAFIAMEFIRGKELKSYFDSNERFQLKDIVNIMSQLLDALEYSHRRGVVHRDIKPSNIIFTEDGQVKVADFGIARIESSHLTQAGTILGTPTHMSPEQFMGLAVDGRTDIYSSGVILYQFLTGEKPFSGSVVNIMHKVLNQEPVPPSALNFSAPRLLDDIVKKAMSKRPEDRFQTAYEFKESLKAVVESLPSSRDDIDSDATLISTNTFSATPEPTPLDAQTSNTDISLWKKIKNSQELNDFYRYLQQNPDGEFVELAKLRITALEAQAKLKAEEDAKRKAREDAERKVREEAERKAREEAERKAREEAERKAREEAERKAREEAERKAREEAERKAREEAERKAREEAERKVREEAERKAAHERREKQRAKEEAERKAEKERLATPAQPDRIEHVLDADSTIIAGPEPTRAPDAQPGNQKKSPVVFIAAGLAAVGVAIGIWLYIGRTPETDSTKKIEETPVASLRGEQATEKSAPRLTPPPASLPPSDEVAKSRDLAEANRKAEARTRAEAEAKIREAEAKVRADAEAKAKAREAEAKARAEADAKAREAEARTRAEAEAKIREAEAKVRADAEAKAKAREAEAKARAEADAKAREVEAKARAEADTKAREAEAKARAEADAKAREVEAKARAEADTKARDAEAKTRAEAEAKASAEAELRNPVQFQKGQQYESDGDWPNAMKAYLASANAGYGPAMKKLGDIYGKGNSSVPRDYAASIKWYNKAKQAGVAMDASMKR